MEPTRYARLHWHEMVWYSWTVSAALVIAGAALGYLLGFGGACRLIGA